ncbi:Hypothetical protein SMAX5B_011436 [Scophthalmus maximus]|uniref:Uncharacterized protein n=1 Tax=Scophthalmus maximus TaxID=52904 RepID=A0A2U9BMW6_SCOMX|nr:Hypothetical protein SMAX5B_011436 [Scophthalmus maximus]
MGNWTKIGAQATELRCLQKPEKRGSENQFSVVGVPQGLVLGPSQVSYSPGAMFFPQGAALQTDSQTAPPVLCGPCTASQGTTLLRSSLVERELSGPAMSPYPIPLPLNI